MTSYLYVDKLGKHLVSAKRSLDNEILGSQVLSNEEGAVERSANVQNGPLTSKKEASKSQYVKLNSTKLPSISANAFDAIPKKGDQINVGGFNWLSGLAKPGKVDKNAAPDIKTKIKDTGLNFDVLGRLHYMEDSPYYTVRAPRSKIMEDNINVGENVNTGNPKFVCSKRTGGIKPAAVDYGFNKKNQFGYNSVDHGPASSKDVSLDINKNPKTSIPTPGIQLPVKLRTGTIDQLNNKISSKDRASIGATYAYGYNGHVDVSEQGYLRQDLNPGLKLNTLSHGITTLPSNIPYKDPFGYNRGRGYTGSGRKTVGIVPESTHILPTADGLPGQKKGPVGFKTAVLFNSKYPKIKNRLVA